MGGGKRDREERGTILNVSLVIYLAVLGRSCNTWHHQSSVHYLSLQGVDASCGAQALELAGSRLAESRLSFPASCRVSSSPNKESNPRPCTERQILNH